jgi:hypothetical protein
MWDKQSPVRDTGPREEMDGNGRAHPDGLFDPELGINPNNVGLTPKCCGINPNNVGLTPKCCGINPNNVGLTQMDDMGRMPRN